MRIFDLAFDKLKLEELGLGPRQIADLPADATFLAIDSSSDYLHIIYSIEDESPEPTIELGVNHENL